MKDKITVIRLDTDNAEDINKFKELWMKMKADVVFVPKNTKFIFEGRKKNDRTK